MKKQVFLPTVLIIDDDSAVTSYMRKNFHDHTPLGVLVANSLREAKTLLDNKDLPIDAVIADLFFAASYQDRENQFFDGIDILKHARNVRSDAELYVFSIWSERNLEREKAAKFDLGVKEWFHKMFYDPRHQEKTPWRQIYREQIIKQLKSNKDLCEQFKKQGLKDMDSFESVVESIEQSKLPRRTFLQELNDGQHVVKKPIQVLWSKEEDEEEGEVIIAKDLSIGLTEGFGETVDDALNDLAEKILDQKEVLDDEPEDNILDFGKLLKERLAHIVKRDKEAIAA